MKSFVLAATAACLLSASTCMAQSSSSPIVAPGGLTVEKLPATLSAPRLIAFAPGGELVVGSNSGKVYRLKAPYTTSETLVDFGGQPHSVAFRTVGQAVELWIGDTTGVYKVAYDATKSYKKSDFIKVATLPGGAGHSSRTVKVGPDNEVYVSLGIANNCSVQYLDDSYPVNDRRGGIYHIDQSTSTAKLVPYARGLRNPVGFAWQPDTGVMYANNNGPDHWGFEQPREVFVEVHDQSFFGMPWYQVIDGKVTADSCAPADKAPAPASAVELPVATFDARSAPMEVAFVGASQLNSAWAGSALVALHGSWAIPTGGSDADRRHP